MYRLVTINSIINRRKDQQTDRQTDDIIMPIDDHSANETNFSKALLCTAHETKFLEPSPRQVFLPRDASAERGNATVSRPSVCLSVRPSVCDV